MHAFPGEGIDVPVWLLGSSRFSAGLAATLGLPYAFASHFAPDALDAALAIYRHDFRPSAYLDRPCAMLGLNVVAAATDAEARRLFTSQQQSFVNLRRGHPARTPPPMDDIEGFWAPHEKAMVEHALACAVVGGEDSVRRGIEAFIDRHHPDELILTAILYDPARRVESFERIAAAMALQPTPAAAGSPARRGQ